MNKIFIFTIVASLFILSACKKVKTPDAVAEREAWIGSFTDSVEYYKDLSENITLQLDRTNAEIADLLNNFETVRNPREVSGFYILKGWNSKLPFVNTGIYARLNEDEKLELIATLGGNTFNQISVNGLVSEVVHHDQAFNFRHERFNTVYFSGGKCDTIVEYISQHAGEPLKLDYLEGKKKISFSITADEKEMIHKTWLLYSAQMKARSLQKELWFCSRKIDTFRRFMNQD